MTDRQRGAAQVSLMWLIAVGVITLFTILFAFLGQQKLSQVEEQLEAQRKTVESWTDRLDEKEDELVRITATVGFPSSTARAIASPEQIKAAVEELVNTFPSVQAGTATLEAALPAVVADYNGLLAKVRDATQQVAQLRNDLAARQTEVRKTIREKDDTSSSLRRELEDTRSSLNTQIADLERQRDALRTQVRDLERERSELTVQFDLERRGLSQARNVLADRNNILSERLNSVERRADAPDGSLLTVSATLSSAFLDLGRLQRLQPGLEFEVRDPRTGAVKGRVQVTRVEDRRSQVRIIDQADPYSPLVPGDAVFNPLFDPERRPIAVLLGNGFGTLNSADMRALLTEVGLEVRDKVDRESDFLILGTPFFDPDTGERIDFESRDEYKEAESLSVHILPMRDVMGWLGI